MESHLKVNKKMGKRGDRITPPSSSSACQEDMFRHTGHEEMMSQSEASLAKTLNTKLVQGVSYTHAQATSRHQLQFLRDVQTWLDIIRMRVNNSMIASI